MSGATYQVHCYDGKTGFLGELWFDHWPTQAELLPGTIRSDIALPVDAAGPSTSRGAANAAESPDVCTSLTGQKVEPMVRFCPGCGSVGEVDRKYRDCCPDGSHARSIPKSLAARCHDLFYLALRGAVEAEATPANQRVDWLEFERIGDLPEVDEAIRALLADQTEDNATALIRAVVKAAGHQLSQPISQAARDVLDERHRQIDVEGWTADHDDHHDAGELAGAGAAYALHASDALHPLSQGDAYRDGSIPPCWLWCSDHWKPGEPRRNLVKAAALILAEIERLDRVGVHAPAGGPA